MTMSKNKAVKKIMDILLALPEGDRKDVFSSVRFNDTFCVDCGYGSEDHPNPRCSCQNDE